MDSIIRCCGPFGLALLFCAATAGPVEAAGWSVAPIRVYFDGQARTAALRVESTNAENLDFQVRLMRWSQDEDGRDQYESSEDLLYFPRRLSLPPGKQQVIRVGLKSPQPEREQTYRLFIEELPKADDAADASQIAVRLRFGVPIFVGPRSPQEHARLTDTRLHAGQLETRLVNTGNRHIRFEHLQVAADEQVLGAADGWYLLAGASRFYRIALDPTLCTSLHTAEVRLQTRGGFSLNRALAIPADQCAVPD